MYMCAYMNTHAYQHICIVQSMCACMQYMHTLSLHAIRHIHTFYHLGSVQQMPTSA